MRADTLRRIGYFTAPSFLIFLLTVSLVVPVNITFSSQTVEGGQFPQSIIASSSTDTTPHTLELKAVQDGDNAEPRKVSGFRLDMTNVVTAQINSQLLVFVTDSSVRVLEAKVRTVSDQLIDLISSTQANAFSLVNLPAGVYTLDVITQKGNTKAAYEGILVISQQPTTVINETTKNVINQEINQNTRIDVDIRIIFKENKKPKPPSPCYFDPSLDECKPKNGKCPPGFGFNDDDQCIPTGECPKGYGRLDDDETGKCYKNSDIKKCPDGYITHKDMPCPDEPIICTDEISYGRGPCDEEYIPPDKNGKCPAGHKYIDEDTGCVPEWFQTPESCPEGQTGTPPDCTPIEPIICPEGQVGTPPNCETPPEECPEGTTGTPPDCEPIEPPEECPEGTTGTPPDCTPIEPPPDDIEPPEEEEPEEEEPEEEEPEG